MTPLQTDIERRLAQSEPDVEVLLAEVLGGRLGCTDGELKTLEAEGVIGTWPAGL